MTTATTHSNMHPKSSALCRSPTFTEKILEGVVEFDTHLAVVDTEASIVGVVEDHVYKFDKEDRQRYVVEWRHRTFFRSRSSPQTSFFCSPF